MSQGDWQDWTATPQPQPLPGITKRGLVDQSADQAFAVCSFSVSGRSVHGAQPQSQNSADRPERVIP